MTCTDAQWTPEEEHQFIRHILDWIGNDAIAAAIRDSLGIYQDIDHTIDLLSSNEDLINALKNQKGSFDIKNKEEFEIIKNRMIAIPAFIRSINEQNLYTIGRSTFSLQHLREDFNALVNYIPSEDYSLIPALYRDIIQCANIRSKDTLWDTIFDDVCQQQCTDISHSDESFPSIIESDGESSNNEWISGEKDNVAFVLDIGTGDSSTEYIKDGTFTTGLWDEVDSNGRNLPSDNGEKAYHAYVTVGRDTVGDSAPMSVGTLAHGSGSDDDTSDAFVPIRISNEGTDVSPINDGDAETSITITTSSKVGSVERTAVEDIMHRTGDTELVFLYKTSIRTDKKTRRALSRHLTGTSTNYQDAVDLAGPYITTIQKYVRRFLSRMKVAKMRGPRRHRQITFVRHPLHAPGFVERDWGASTIMLILMRHHDRMSCTMPYHVVHDWQLIDLFVRDFSDKIGDRAVRFEISHDTPRYTLHQHANEFQRRYGFTFPCVPRSTRPISPSTSSVLHMLPSVLTRYDLCTFSAEDTVVDGPRAGDNRIQIGWGVDYTISVMPSVSHLYHNHTDNVAMSDLPPCGRYAQSYARLLLNDMDQDLGVFTASSSHRLGCSAVTQATEVDDGEGHIIYTTIGSHTTSDNYIISSKTVLEPDAPNDSDCVYQDIDLILRQHYEAPLVICSSPPPTHAPDDCRVLLKSERSLHFALFFSSSFICVYTCLPSSGTGSSIPLLSPVRAGTVGFIRFGIDDGEILDIDIGEKACTGMTMAKEWGSDNDIDKFVLESPYARLTIIHLPRSTYVCVNVIHEHPLPMHIKVASFWGISLAFVFEIGVRDIVLLYLMLRQRAAIRIYGEQSRATLVLMTRCPDWDDDIDLLDNGNGSSMPLLQGSCSSSVANDASVYTSPTNTKEFGLPIYANTQDDDDKNDTHHPAYSGRINCPINFGASEYGEPCCETTNNRTIIITHHNLRTYTLLASNVSGDNHDNYTNDSASRVALISEINDAFDDLVAINTNGSELQTSGTIEQHDAHAPEHGEPSELNSNNSTTCHKSVRHTLTRRDHQYYIDGSLSYSTAYSSNATEWHDNYVGVKLECKRLLFVEYISLTLVHVDRSSLRGSLERNSNVKTGPTSKCDNNYVGGIICGHNHNIVTRLRSMVTKYIMNSTLLPAPINIGSHVHTSNYFEYAIQQGITSDNVRRYSITPSAISTLVGDCTHPNMGSMDIVIVTTRCAFVGLHPLHGNTWPYSLNIVQRMTFNTAPIDGLEKDLPCGTLNWDGNTVIVYTAAFDCTIINAINYLSARSVTYSTSSDAHKSISAYAPRGTANIVLAYMSGINTAISCHLQRDNAITLSTGSAYRYGIPSDTTYISLGYSNIGNNHNDIGIILVDGTLVSSTIHPLNKMCHSVHNNLNSSTMDTNDNDLGNVDRFSMPRTNARVSDYITSNHELMPGCKLDRCSTDNTHTGTGSEESLACAVTYDETQMYITYNNEMNTLWMRASNGCMNCIMIRECERSSSRCNIVIIQYDTIMQSWKLDNEMGFTLDNSMHVNEMKPCYLFQLTILYMHVVQTDGEYVMKRGELTLDLCLGTRILISWMTKANRRGVTCTGEYGFVWYLVVPLFVRKSSFERELESRIHLA